jgi:hypothetical protein
MAEKRDDGGVVLRCARAWIALSEAELDRVISFARNEATLQRFPMAPKMPLTAPETDDPALSG